MLSLDDHPSKKQKTDSPVTIENFLKLPEPKEDASSHPVSLMLPDKPWVCLEDLTAVTFATATIWAWVLKAIEGGYTVGNPKASVQMNEVTLLTPSFKFEYKDSEPVISVKEIAAVFNQFTGKKLQDQEALFKDNQVDKANITARLEESISRMHVLEIPQNLSLSWVLLNIA
jgi:hypothetical protein